MKNIKCKCGSKNIKVIIREVKEREFDLGQVEDAYDVCLEEFDDTKWFKEFAYKCNECGIEFDVKRN